MKLRFLSIVYLFLFSGIGFAESSMPTVSNLTAKQRYPWNGLVDIECDIAYSNTNEDLFVTFVATNLSTNLELPVCTVHRSDGGAPVVKAGHCSFIWDAGADVESVKIGEVSLNVEAKTAGVQLWENGPYWAECNVGAITPQDYGYYFWWGDTVGYKRNGGNNGWVSVADGVSFSFNDCPTDGKYDATLRSEGWIDASGNLAAAHDAATAHIGAPWRMPTNAEWSALISNCDTVWTTQGGVSGRLVKGRGAYASKSIFLPAAGLGYESDLHNAGSAGDYWSSTPYSYDAWNFFFDSGGLGRVSSNRYGGQSVRPLRGFAE